MRAHEILLEMAYSRKTAERVVTSLQRQINLHVAKLLACDASAQNRNHWKAEIHEWVDTIACIKIKPNMRPIPAATVYQWLYDEPFGGSEVENVMSVMRVLKRNDHALLDIDPQVVSDQLRAFHTALAEHVARNDPAEDLIDAL